MAVIISDDFNSGSYNGTWTFSSPGVPTVSANAAYEGGYGSQNQTSTGSQDTYFRYNAAQKAEIYTRLYWRHRDGRNTAAWYIIYALASLNPIYIQLGYTDTPAVRWWLKVYTNYALRLETAGSLEEDVWYPLLMRVKMAGADTVVELKTFGETLTDNTNYGTSNITESIFNSYNSSAVLTTVDYDYVTLDDAAYPAGLEQFARPSADSVDGSWTTQSGGSSLYEVIDETTPDKTDYVQSKAF